MAQYLWLRVGVRVNIEDDQELQTIPEDALSLTLADLGGVCESILHASPDMDWNFYTVLAWPGHERNLMRPYFVSDCGDGIAEGETDFEYHAAVLGLRFFDLARSGVHSVTTENEARTAGVGAQDGVVGSLTPGLDAEMGADLLKRVGDILPINIAPPK